MVSYSAIAVGAFLMRQSIWKGKMHWSIGLFGATLAGVNLNHLGYVVTPSELDKNFTRNMYKYGK
jgi:hypothetical protein